MMPLCILLAFLSQLCQVPAVHKISSITQDSGVKTAKVGGNVTLQCVCQDDSVTFIFWYQQTLGGKPQLISSRMKHGTEAEISPEFKERFQVLAKGGASINHLIITDLHLSDSATYYCGILEFNAIEFGQGAFLHVKTSLSNIQAAVHQPSLQPFQSGDSVNLSCTVHAEPCVGEQSFYWFRHGASQPAVIYPRTGQCKNISNEESVTKSCTLNLSIKSVSSSDAGIYYCALSSCGEIVFGNGTEIKIAGVSTKDSILLVYCLSVALAVFIIVLLVLVFIVHKLKKNLCSVCHGTVSHLTCSAASDAASQDANSLHYAALSLNRNSERHRREDNVESVCVYSKIKSRKE
ncbi:uncharacterized protein LOC122973259 [Thunnus albacares]|uniref:uncharacterized protein LOC121890025 n=1 Tax=Thunnus maccoyii TaxID=8240 RepID=UPI001C4C43DA|nr:uncharacterized protein LOC121890025 [Thunnus maccoyii]XP_044196595.1 uncharacterized protein LOC122973259 [Thunnus albacares]